MQQKQRLFNFKFSTTGQKPCLPLAMVCLRQYYYIITFLNVKKYLFFYLKGGTLNPVFSLRICSSAWVVFLETDCKIKATKSIKIESKSQTHNLQFRKFIQTHFPSAKTYYYSKKTFLQFTHRSTLNLFQCCNRYQFDIKIISLLYQKDTKQPANPLPKYPLHHKTPLIK